MIKLVCAAGVALLALCGPAYAVIDSTPYWSPSGPHPRVAEPLREARNVVAEPGEVLCKVEPRPGSRIGVSRICLTRAQWSAVARRSAVWLEGIQSTPDSAPVP